jgi:hypothetical protein
VALTVSSFFSDQSHFCDLGHFYDPDHTVFLEYVRNRKTVADQSPNVSLRCRQGKKYLFPLEGYSQNVYSALLLSIPASVPPQKNPYIHEE